MSVGKNKIDRFGIWGSSFQTFDHKRSLVEIEYCTCIVDLSFQTFDHKWSLAEIKTEIKALYKLYFPRAHSARSINEAYLFRAISTNSIKNMHILHELQ